MPTKTSFTMSGVSDMKAQLKQTAKSLGAEAAKAMTEELKVEAIEVRRRTPVRTGALRDSVKVVPAVYDETTRTITGSIVAGGDSIPYALVVHEDLDAFHRVGQAKFLESVLLEFAPYAAQRIGVRIDMNRVAKKK